MSKFIHATVFCLLALTGTYTSAAGAPPPPSAADINSAKDDGSALGGALGSNGAVSIDSSGNINGAASAPRGSAAGQNSQSMASDILGAGALTRTGNKENGTTTLAGNASAELICPSTSISYGGDIVAIHGLSVRLSRCNLPTQLFLEVCDASMVAGSCEDQAAGTSNFAGAMLSVGSSLALTTASGRPIGAVTVTSCNATTKKCVITYKMSESLEANNGSLSGLSADQSNSYGDSAKSDMTSMYSHSDYRSNMATEGPYTKNCVDQVEHDMSTTGTVYTCDPSLGSFTFDASTRPQGACGDSMVCDQWGSYTSTSEKECIRQIATTGVKCETTVPTGTATVVRNRGPFPCYKETTTKIVFNYVLEKQYCNATYDAVNDIWALSCYASPTTILACENPDPGAPPYPSCFVAGMIKTPYPTSTLTVTGCEEQEAALR